MYISLLDIKGLTARIAGDFGSSRVVEVDANGRSGRERRFWPTLVDDCAGRLRARLLHGDLALRQPATAFALDGERALDGAGGATDGSLCGAFWGANATSGWRLELPLAEPRTLGNITILWTGRIAPEEYSVTLREAGECILKYYFLYRCIVCESSSQFASLAPLTSLTTLQCHKGLECGLTSMLPPRSTARRRCATWSSASFTASALGGSCAWSAYT